MTAVSTIAKGDGSGVTTPRRVVIRDESAWRVLWVEHAGAASVAPDIDFALRMVAAVFGGDRPTPGYGIEIVDARQHGEAMEIVVRESRAPAGMIAAQVVVTPFHIVSLPRFDGATSFTT
jgi:hypothetical protein